MENPENLETPEREEESKEEVCSHPSLEEIGEKIDELEKRVGEVEKKLEELNSKVEDLEKIIEEKRPILIEVPKPGVTKVKEEEKEKVFERARELFGK